MLLPHGIFTLPIFPTCRILDFILIGPLYCLSRTEIDDLARVL
jgi:hypothetical protein